eukprot:1645794-Pyramimonas_sp.AAC.2
MWVRIVHAVIVWFIRGGAVSRSGIFFPLFPSVWAAFEQSGESLATHGTRPLAVKRESTYK